MLNFIDFIVFAFLLYFVWQGYKTGLLGGIFNAISTIISFVAALVFYPQVGGFLSNQFGWSENLSLVGAFFFIFIGLEILFSLLFNYFYSLLAPIYKKIEGLKTADKVLGILPSLLIGAFLISLFLLIPLILPVKKNFREPIASSFWGTHVLSRFLDYQPQVESLLSRLPYKNLSYLITPGPLSSESIELDVPKEIKLVPDPKAEREMFDLVNKERRSTGLQPVVWSEALIGVGRKHCLDMFSRGYFSHYSPEGKSPFNRMDDANVDYKAAGENLAYAPNVSVAHQGLMNSKGHRENILREEFATLGVGVIDGGIHGQMLCQEFTD